MFGFLDKRMQKLIVGLAVSSLLLASCAKSQVYYNDPYAASTVGYTDTGSSYDYSSSSSYGSSYGSSAYGSNISGGYTTTDLGALMSNTPTGSIAGRVIDTFTNMGIPNAKVEVVGMVPVVSAVTDASGNYNLPKVPKGRMVLTVTKEEYTTLSGNSNIVVNVEAANTINAPDIYLVPDKASIANGFVKSFDGLKHPRGVAIDKTNNQLYVVDVVGIGGILSYDRAEVKKLNTDGGIVDTFGSRMLSIDIRTMDLFRMMKKSTGIGVDAGGNLYIADTGTNSIKKYGPTGSYITTIEKEFKNLIDVEVLTTGEIVVSDPGNARIVLLDSSANIKLDNLLGTDSSDGIRGICLDNADNIYVIDSAATAGNVIKKFDRNGNKLSLQFGIIGGLEPGYFNNPTDLAVDSRNGDIYVVDSGNNRIQRFNSEGEFLSEFGQFGSENGSFSSPWGIAIDNSGFVYVADSKNARIEKFMPGRFSDSAY